MSYNVVIQVIYKKQKKKKKENYLKNHYVGFRRLQIARQGKLFV